MGRVGLRGAQALAQAAWPARNDGEYKQDSKDSLCVAS